MIRLCILCEGETEEEFVKSCLVPTFLLQEIYITPILLGGNVSIERIARLVRHNVNFDQITTLVDFYGFKNNPYKRKMELEVEILRVAKKLFKTVDISKKFFPYVQMYEFEGLLFTDVRKFEEEILECEESHLKQLEKIRAEVKTPEEINNGAETAPSKRLENIFGSDYKKVLYGSEIAKSIGLPRIRAECPQFDAWMKQIEQLR